MYHKILRIALLFIGLIIGQVLIFNHIILFNVAVPLVFIYLVIRMPMDFSRNILLTLSFLLGLCIDIFADTPGVNSLACTIMVMLKRPVFYAYNQRDDKTKEITPCIATLGWGVYSKYMLTMVSIFSLLVFSIEYFSFIDVKEVVVMAAASTLLTFILLLGIDSLILPSHEKRL